VKKIQLYRTEGGEIVDDMGMKYSLPQKEEGAINNSLYRSNGLDIDGDVTVTGNLTVQQSQWVYLRGPITGSGAVINGPITASNLLIRGSIGDGQTDVNWGNVEIEGEMVVNGVNLLDTISRLEERIQKLETDGNKK
jgi:hypothetical protein